MLHSVFFPLLSTEVDLHETRLLEHLAICPLVRLSFDFDWLIPAPLVLQELLVFWLGRVKLGELIALKVRGDIKGWESLIPTDEESTLDDGVIAGTINGGTSEDVLAGGLETIEETAWGIISETGAIFVICTHQSSLRS